MDSQISYPGYSEFFINPDVKVPLPILAPDQLADLAPVAGTTNNIADYVNYSLAQSKSRGFLFFAASNIKGDLFKKAPRKNNWRKDDRLDPAFQWGEELYKAPSSDFDKGHMVKREDVQWGKTVLEAQYAADSTFFYTNAVPQHADLNQKIWADLEDYILHTETVENNLRINVFTGPVLRITDPTFVSEVNGKEIKLPTLFWKVVLYPKSNHQLFRVGFLMGQQKLLEKNGLVRSVSAEKKSVMPDLFMEFEDAETYQVAISTIEKLTNLTMPIASDAYQDERPIKLILEEVDVPAEFHSTDPYVANLGFRIPNLVL